MVFAAMVVALVGLASPASARVGSDVTAALVPHCTYTRLEITVLPTTGTDVATIALAGLGVVIAGAAVLFVLHLRRRRLAQQ